MKQDWRPWAIPVIMLGAVILTLWLRSGVPFEIGLSISILLMASDL